MADGREKQQDAHNKTESTSMKGQTSESGTRDSSDQRTDRSHETRRRSGAQIMGLAPDSGPSGSRRSGWRHGTEPDNRGNRYSGIRINEPGQIRDHRESDIQQQQGPRDTRGPSTGTDSRRTQQQRASTQYYEGGGSGSQRRSDNTSPISSVYPVRPSQPDCWHYLRSGRCDWKSRCCFNHQKGPVRVNCEYFLRGICKFGERCRNIHPMETDGAQPIQRDSGVNALGQENLQEQGPSDIERQRQEAEESDRKRKRELENAEREIRQKLDEEKPENSGVNALGQENVQEQREIDIDQQREIERMRREDVREIERMRREDLQRLNEMRQTVVFDSAAGTTKEFEELVRRREGD